MPKWTDHENHIAENQDKIAAWKRKKGAEVLEALETEDWDPNLQIVDRIDIHEERRRAVREGNADLEAELAEAGAAQARKRRG